MSQTAEQQELINSIESLLVEGFRKLQSLLALTKEERTAFLNDKVTALEDLVDKKEVLLDDLNQIEINRQMLVEALAEDLGLTNEGITLAQVVPVLEPRIETRLRASFDGCARIGRGSPGADKWQPCPGCRRSGPGGRDADFSAQFL